ncbi:MAG: hypothetical protein HeimAB125_07710 [Candidatus Heimdallarchaeota archaeon AB_125]|nr:MAG: hypothetical protein HeimAB125_07710 [Candidatus Heimdallarchaeota archaeon AB_125]
MKTVNKSPYTIILEEFSNKMIYDGSQISSHYAAEKYGVIGESILVFRGGMKLSPKEMVDIKDIIRESHLSNILISSDDSLHFIIEEFDIQPPNMEIEYYRLRILTQITIDILKEKEIEVEKKGTDIFIDGKKLNVGIATVGKSSSKIHFGLNILSTGVPEHVQAVGLLDLGINVDEIQSLAIQIAENYAKEISRIKEDVAKTRTI